MNHNDEPYADVVATIQRIAKDSFANHVVTEEAPGEYRVARPGTGIYGFWLLFRPGMVCVWGDLGEWVLRHGDRDSVGWFRGASNSPEYLCEKTRAGNHEEFYPYEAIAHLKELAADDYSPARDALERLGDMEDPLSEHDYREACYHCGVDDPWDGMKLGSSALWLVEMARLFDRLMREKQEVAA